MVVSSIRRFYYSFPKMANSTTVCLTTLDELNDEKTAKRIPAIVYLSVSMVIGILGNLLVICVYFGPLKKNKKAHWTFIRSLAVSDFVVCVVVIPFELFQQTHQLTFHSAAACQLLRSVSVFSTIVSSFLVLFMSAHRVRLVCQPLKQQLTSRQAIYCIITIAVIGVVFAWPEAALSGISMETLQCNLTGYDCSFSDRFEDKWFTTAYSAVLQSIFLICIVGLIIMYSVIAYTTINFDESKSRKMTIIAFAISFGFILSYLPFVSVKLNASIKAGRFIKNDVTDAIFPILGRMFILHNIINPILYLFLDVTFREESKKLFQNFKIKPI